MATNIELSLEPWELLQKDISFEKVNMHSIADSNKQKASPQKILKAYKRGIHLGNLEAH